MLEVTTDDADIVWTVNIANKKSEKKPPPKPPANRDENIGTPATLNTKSPTFTCQRLRPKAGLPNLGYMFLERNDNEVSKVTGRLHVIGNEGEFKGTTDPGNGPTDRTTLWSDDWYDSAGDGSVEADVKPKNSLLAKVGASDASKMKYLNEGDSTPQAGSLTTIKAAPAWVVIGCPDYSPDMGHFVSLWDLAVSQALTNLSASNVKKQSGKHKLIPSGAATDTYKKTDYFVHIHPHLCLFKDVRFVSGEAYGKREEDKEPKVLDRGHNKPPPEAAPAAGASLEAKVTYGGISLDARVKSKKDDLWKKDKLRENHTKPIDEWVKIAIFRRLRKPGNLYTKKKFMTDFKIDLLTDTPGDGNKLREDAFPRKYGRRMDYDSTDPTSDKLKYYDVPDSILDQHPGSLRDYHGKLDSPGTLCGGPKSPPKSATHPSFPGNDYDDARLALLDDMFWPASFADMPLLRELAFTPNSV